MTWRGTRKGVTPEGERYYEHTHPHGHRGVPEHEHRHKHHSLRPHRHVWPVKEVAA